MVTTGKSALQAIGPSHMYTFQCERYAIKKACDLKTRKRKLHVTDEQAFCLPMWMDFLFSISIGTIGAAPISRFRFGRLVARY